MAGGPRSARRATAFPRPPFPARRCGVGATTAKWWPETGAGAAGKASLHPGKGSPRAQKGDRWHLPRGGSAAPKSQSITFVRDKNGRFHGSPGWQLDCVQFSSSRSGCSFGSNALRQTGGQRRSPVPLNSSASLKSSLNIGCKPTQPRNRARLETVADDTTESVRFLLIIRKETRPQMSCSWAHHVVQILHLYQQFLVRSKLKKRCVFTLSHSSL